MSNQQLLSASEYAAQHGISHVRVRQLLQQGRIEGAFKVGNRWIVPANAALPTDGRVTTGEYRNWRKSKDSED